MGLFMVWMGLSLLIPCSSLISAFRGHHSPSTPSHWALSFLFKAPELQLLAPRSQQEGALWILVFSCRRAPWSPGPSQLTWLWWSLPSGLKPALVTPFFFFFPLLDISKCDDEQDRQFKNAPRSWRNFSQKLNLFRVRILNFSGAVVV